VELAHPHDVGVLLLTLAGATTAAEARARLRWRLGDTWLVMEMEVTLCEAGDGPTFGVVLEPGPFGPSLQSLVAALPAMSDLPVRQREVLVRLARGERVPQIAKEMYLSPKTVRNHLAAIFRKAGVHSQQQLLARLRHPRE